MNIRTLIAISILGLTTAACTSNSNSNSTKTSTTNSSTTSSASHTTSSVAKNEAVSRNETFECRNGMTVSLTQNNVNSLSISVDTNNSSATLHRTQAASGALYTNKQGLNGKNTEWHEKGGEAVFEFSDPYGNVTETVCKMQ